MHKVMVAALAAAVLAGCADDAFDEPRVVPLSAVDSGTVVEVSVGDEILLDLEANWTTGYTWVDESPESAALRAVGEPVLIEESGLVGAAGVMRCRFEAVNIGTAALELAYRRPWEDDVEPERTFSVTVVVR